MSGLPTGLFQPGYSLIHRMNPTVKLLCLLTLLVAVVSTDTLIGYLILGSLILCLIRMAKMNLSTALGSVKRLIWFFVLIFLMNTCFFSPEDPWVRLWIFAPSYAGMMQGVHVVVRVLLLLILSNILTVTTAPLALTGAIEQLISPLRFIGVPTHQVAMILSVAIQFIPTLMEETDMIRKAQTARGARFDSRNLMEKAKAILPLVVPIFLAAFKRADELSLAMESRGYHTGVRSIRTQRTPLRKADLAALMICAALCALMLVLL